MAEDENELVDGNRLPVDVVIPAFNEAHSIGRVLADVGSSRMDPPFFLRRVEVWSDCSTDGTDEVVKEFAAGDARMALERACPRSGKSAMLNRVFRRSDAAVLVILDADVGLAGGGTLAELVEPVVTEDAALVGADVVPDRRGSWRIAEAARYFDWQLEKGYRLRAPLSFYSAYGRALALSRAFFSDLHLPSDQADDLYMYFVAARRRGFRFARRAKVFFSPPRSLEDYALQFCRFAYYVEQARREFGDREVKEGIQVPGRAGLFVRAFGRTPVAGVCWLIARLWTQVRLRDKALRDQFGKGTWYTASSPVRSGDAGVRDTLSGSRLDG